MAPRSVLCRAPASTGRRARSSKRCGRRARICAGLSTPMRAAASSMASGRPSSWRTISAIAAASSPRIPSPPPPRRTRSTKSSAASSPSGGTRSGATSKTTSSRRRSLSREVTRKRARRVAASQAPTVAAACSTICSMLSSTRRTGPRPASAAPSWATASSPRPAAASGTTSARATQRQTSSTVVASVRSQSQTPPSHAAASPAAPAGRERRLADARRPGERDEAVGSDRRAHLRDVGRAPDEEPVLLRDVGDLPHARGVSSRPPTARSPRNPGRCRSSSSRWG